MPACSRRTALVALLLASCRDRRPPAPRAVGRVVSLSPSTTETMFAIGAGPLVVGRSRYCDHPPEALSLPAVGGYVDPSLEAILALSPDLVIGARGPAGPSITERLARHDVPTYFPPTESMQQIDEMIVGVGERVGKGSEARAKVGELASRRDEIRRRRSGGAHPRVLMVFGVTPISAAGPGSFADEMLAIVGARNAVATGAAYPQLGLEHVIALDPDLVIDAAHQEHKGAGLGPPWAAVRAVREGRVVAIASEALLRPGPRIGEGLVELERAVHRGAP